MMFDDFGRALLGKTRLRPHTKEFSQSVSIYVCLNNYYVSSPNKTACCLPPPLLTPYHPCFLKSNNKSIRNGLLFLWGCIMALVSYNAYLKHLLRFEENAGLLNFFYTEHYGINENLLIVPLSALIGMILMIRRNRGNDAVIPFTLMPIFDSLSAEAQISVKRDVERRSKSMVFAFIAWFFLGWHYLYLKRIGLQVVFWFTLGGFGVWWFIDLFRVAGIVNAMNEDLARELMVQYKALIP